ncbi:Alpha/Beta hydrolase protein [Mycena floridula]|nr:Alpha/Beta hydrolase protein [Mycena floridula]
MPTTKIKPSAGSLTVKYTISTPSNASTKTIDKNLPTILFLHPVWIGEHIFHPQFCDPQLRKFNLVSLDLRAHGETNGPITKKYAQQEAAEDVAKFMESIKLPSCFIFGMSYGSIVALQLAISYPAKVLGLFLVSPLGREEPEDVALGRQEIYECWKEGFKPDGTSDEEALADAVLGALQLAFNNQKTSFIDACVGHAMPLVSKNLGGTKNLDKYRIATLDFFIKRKNYPNTDLAKIRGPVHLIHCMEDIAYPVEYTTEFFDQLRSAGVDATMARVEGATHFGNVTEPEKINLLLHNMVLANIKTQVPPAPSHVVSPFEGVLLAAGWDEDDDY